MSTSRLIARFTIPTPLKLRVTANGVTENLSFVPPQQLVAWRGDGPGEAHDDEDFAIQLGELLDTHSQLNFCSVELLSTGRIVYRDGAGPFALQFDFDDANTNLDPMWLGWPVGTNLTASSQPLTSPNVPQYVWHPPQEAAQDIIRQRSKRSREVTTGGHPDSHRWRTYEEIRLEYDTLLAPITRQAAEAGTLGSYERFFLDVTDSTELAWYYQPAPVFAVAFPSVTGALLGPFYVAESFDLEDSLSESDVTEDGVELWNLRLRGMSVPL